MRKPSALNSALLPRRQLSLLRSSVWIIRSTGSGRIGRWRSLKTLNPIVFFVKEILHSDRYRDGECLTDEDEKEVTEKLLAYHPHSEDKIGCGLDSIMTFHTRSALEHTYGKSIPLMLRDSFVNISNVADGFIYYYSLLCCS
ncbi:DNA-directed RNA polymerase protein [Dioscorea alata]|uniref:DNA-directed RNA polymerase protein n=1 Tax=Dioscorea alata TaxID=55571 RepID=A0ACB7VF29_DIOAL|nr:DNA-directed RNA polymerase protein [Dioscorea alata]